MRKNYLLLAVAALLTTLCGCNPYTLVNNQVYSESDLASFTTYRIVSPENDSISLPPSMTLQDYAQIVADIRQQMNARGYTEDPTSALLINIGLSEHKGLATEPLMVPNYYPYMGPPPPPMYAPWFMYPRQYYWPTYRYTGQQVVVGIYHAGVLTMDMVDAVNKKLLFTASVGTIMQDGSFATPKGIQKAVNTLFSRYPISK